MQLSLLIQQYVHQRVRHFAMSGWFCSIFIYLINWSIKLSYFICDFLKTYIIYINPVAFYFYSIKAPLPNLPYPSYLMTIKSFRAELLLFFSSGQKEFSHHILLFRKRVSRFHYFDLYFVFAFFQQKWRNLSFWVPFGWKYALSEFLRNLIYFAELMDFLIIRYEI